VKGSAAVPALLDDPGWGKTPAGTASEFGRKREES
jgi:hypothetical protein